MVALDPPAGSKDAVEVSSALTANHFGHRENDDVVVDLFWSRGVGDEFRVEVEDRREQVRFVLRPTTGKEAIHALLPPVRGRQRCGRRRSRGRVTSAPRPVLAQADYTAYNTPYAHAAEAPMSVPHALLALLSEGPKYGLRLQNEFEARTGEVWPLNVGQVYTTLQRLERDGLVETDDGGDERSRKRYRITSAGDRELAEWLRTPPELVPPPRDELVIKLLVALQIPGIEIHELLQAHRRHVVEIMQRYTRIKAEAAEDDVPLALVADAELFRLEAIVRWLDAADVRLKQLPPATPPSATDLAPEPTHAMEVSQ
jgi:DNA-binding PadR family transcriptional regulator